MRRLGSNYYRISKKGLPDSYLFGTIHLPLKDIPGLNNFHPEQSAGFKLAKQVFVERDLSTQKALLESLVKDNDRETIFTSSTVKNCFTDDEIEKINQYLIQHDLETLYWEGKKLSHFAQLISALSLPNINIFFLFDILVNIAILQNNPELNSQIASTISSYIRSSSTPYPRNQKTFLDKFVNNIYDSKLASLAKKYHKRLFELDSEEEIKLMRNDEYPITAQQLRNINTMREYIANIALPPEIEESVAEKIKVLNENKE